ncbi:DUF6276 family protein [Haloferax namakaokahaiae]|uniref:DUF6276 family protein n=1 Tax=Haloferax namakaokahaiae TaxID=1748331 RepID=A0ABD5ZI61_9EURY
MSCSECDGDTAVFAVPDDIASYAPDDAKRVSLCGDCLRVHASDDPVTADSNRSLADIVPATDGGAALALVIGMLDSLALNRAAIVTCLEYAEADGVDVHLALDRLAESVPEAHFDVARRHAQLDSFLDA